MLERLTPDGMLGPITLAALKASDLAAGMKEAKAAMNKWQTYAGEAYGEKEQKRSGRHPEDDEFAKLRDPRLPPASRLPKRQSGGGGGAGTTVASTTFVNVLVR